MSHTTALSIVVHRAENLPKADFIGKIDPYVVLRSSSVFVKTRTIQVDYNPVWEESFTVQVPTPGDGVVRMGLTVVDADIIGSDEDVGAAELVIPLNSLPMRSTRIELQLLPKFAKKQSSPSYVYISVVKLFSFSDLVTRVEHFYADYTRNAGLSTILSLVVDSHKSRVYIPIAYFNGLYLQVRHSFTKPVKISIIDTTKQTDRLAMFCVLGNYSGHYKQKKESWKNGKRNDALHASVFSRVKLDISKDMAHLPWGLIAGGCKVVYSTDTDKIVSEHGWKGSLGYSQAKSVLKNVAFNDSTQSIYFHENFGAFKVDYDPNDVDIEYLQAAQYRCNPQNNCILYCDIEHTERKKRSITCFQNVTKKECGMDFCQIAKLDDMSQVYFKDVRLFVFEMFPNVMTTDLSPLFGLIQ